MPHSKLKREKLSLVKFVARSLRRLCISKADSKQIHIQLRVVIVLWVRINLLIFLRHSIQYSLVEFLFKHAIKNPETALDSHYFGRFNQFLCCSILALNLSELRLKALLLLIEPCHDLHECLRLSKFFVQHELLPLFKVCNAKVVEFASLNISC